MIATYPAAPRDSARMLVVGNALLDKTIRDLTTFLRPGDVMVFNDTRVIPARLLGKRGAAKVEILLHQCHSDQAKRVEKSKRSLDCDRDDIIIWRCFAKPAKRLKPGDCIDFSSDFSAVVMEKLPDGQVVLQFGAEAFHEKLERYGYMPLPPYIEKRRSVIESSVAAKQSNAGSPRLFEPRDDVSSYQTIYAQHAGSVAAPTAGLHFTEPLLAAIDAAGVTRTQVTLHVGGGTFLPVKVEDANDHIMHSEYAVVNEETAHTINTAKERGGRIIAVGTTSLRTLESAADAEGVIRPMARETDIFITPGYRFKTVDVLLTNFHLPKSTLFMLACAFSGLDRMRAAYTHAIQEKYRFYSYGDACLLFRHDSLHPSA